jgi:uncharacterized repeat protein (TIGR01451 family)
MTSDAASYKPSSLVTYTLSVVNNGPSDARRVVVTDTLPTVRFTNLSDTGGCTPSDGTLTCELGDMPQGTGKSFTVSIMIRGARGEVTNTASVESATADDDATNNAASRTVIVQGGG